MAPLFSDQSRGWTAVMPGTPDRGRPKRGRAARSPSRSCSRIRWRPGRHGDQEITVAPSTLRHRLSTALLWAAHICIGGSDATRTRHPARSVPRRRISAQVILRSLVTSRVLRLGDGARNRAERKRVTCSRKKLHPESTPALPWRGGPACDVGFLRELPLPPPAPTNDTESDEAGSQQR